MDATADGTSTDSRRSLIAAMVGTVVEYYDLIVYTYLATVIGPLFFPSASPTASLISALAVFASAYLIRPVGGFFFGHIADRRGRKAALVGSVLCMGAGSLAIGVLPTFADIGVLAPILLLLFRLLQGFSAGGELGGALTFVHEADGGRRKALGASLVSLAVTLGFALAAAVVASVEQLTTHQQLSAWGWRIPFLLSAPLLILCFWLRTRMSEPDRRAQSDHRGSRLPLAEVLRTSWPQVAKVFLIAGAQNLNGYLVLTYIQLYLVREGHYSEATATWIAVFVLVLVSLANLPVARLAARWGGVRVAGFGYIYFAVLAFPALALMTGHGTAVTVVAFLMFALGTPFAQAGGNLIYPALFPPQVRANGVALGFNLATIATGGTASLMAVALVARTGSSIAPGYLVVIGCVIGVGALLTVRPRQEPQTGGDAAAKMTAEPQLR